MQLLKLVIYSFDGQKRELNFRPGRVNIITGASKSGKTQLAEIARFCLGKNDFEVAMGIISEKVHWFGLLVQFPDTQVFIGRPNPGPRKKSTNEAYVLMGQDLAIPEAHELTSNSTTEALVQFLTAKVGIAENLHEPDAGQSRLPLEATIKHAYFYNFQGQFEIASPKILFHQQDDNFKAQSIKDTLPYFLGAVGNDRLARQQELRNLRTRHRRLLQQIEETDALRNEGLTRGRALLAEAAAVGLVPPNILNQSTVPVVPLLEGVRAWTPGAVVGAANDDAIAKLEREREELRLEYIRLSTQHKAAKAYVFDQDEFNDEAREQGTRLRALNLFTRGHANGETCPLCDGSIRGRLASIDDLRLSLTKLEHQLEGTMRERQQLNRFIVAIEGRMTELKRAMAEKRSAAQSLTFSEGEAADAIDQDYHRAVVKGKTIVYLENLGENEDVASLQVQVATVEARIRELDEALDNENVKLRVNSIMNILGREITAWGIELELEHSQYPLRLDPMKLTIMADTQHGPKPMSQMGSGENWVGYHLVAHLALHKWFIEHNRPVPRFVFLDQPTQVYYPAEKDREGAMDVLVDEDRTAVTRMLRLLFRVTEELNGGLQVILTDHVDIQEPWFQECVIERWRNGKKLVPVTWPDGQW